MKVVSDAVRVVAVEKLVFRKKGVCAPMLFLFHHKEHESNERENQCIACPGDLKVLMGCCQPKFLVLLISLLWRLVVAAQSFFRQ